MNTNNIYKGISGEWFNGNEVSDYGKKHGFVDFSCFVKSFNMVLNNDLMFSLQNMGYYFENVNQDYDDQDYDDIFQYFIVDDQAAEIIKNYTNYPLFYNEELDIYFFGITHYGTSWKYVLTDIKTNVPYEELFN